MTNWKPLPPQVEEGDPNHTDHHNMLRDATEQLQTEVDAVAAGGGGGGTGGITQAQLDAAVAPKADRTYVDSQNVAQDAAIDAKNAAQDAAIASKADAAYVDAEDAALQAEIDAVEVRVDALEAGGGAAVGSEFLSGATETNMASWLAARDAGVGQIMAIGTSHVYGWGTTDPGQDAWPWQLAGLIGATRGMEPLNRFSTEITHKRPYITVEGNVTKNGDTSVADMGSLDLVAGTAAITYNAKGCTGFRGILRSWGGNFKAAVDGGAPSTITPPSGPGVVQIATGLTAADHSVKVYDSLGTTSDIRFAALGGHGPGLVLHNFGVPGTQSVNWRKDTGNSPAYMQDGTVSKPAANNSNTGQNWASLRNSVGAVLPDLLLIQIGGGNDTTAQITPTVYGEQLDYIIKWSRGQHSGQTPRDQAIIGLTPFGDDATSVQLRDEMKRVCAANDVPVFDVNALIPSSSNVWTGDGHINTAGHTSIASEMAKAVMNPTWSSGATPATVYTSDTEPTGGTYKVSDLWVSDPGGGAPLVFRGVWTGTDWGEPSALPVDITYATDPGRPEFVIRNDYIADPANRDTMQVWSHGEQTWWVNEWGGLRIRVAENSPWDAPLRLIGASNQGGDMLEVQDSTRQNLLMRIKANGGIVAPNVQDPFVIAYGSDPIPTQAQKPCLVGRIGGTTTRYDYFDGPASGTAASGATGWDSVVGEPPVYSAAAAYSGHSVGLLCNLNGGLSSYVVKKFPNGGYLNEGYARLRVRMPALGDRNAKVFATEATTGGHRHPIRINTSGKVEITSYDGTTILATSTTTLATGTWYDLGVYWKRGTDTTNGSCIVRIYTTVGSDTPAETVTVSAGNFFGAGGDIWALRWGLQASNTGTNLLHIGMVAWSPDGWPSSTPPEGTAALFLHDGTEEIPIASSSSEPPPVIVVDDVANIPPGTPAGTVVVVSPEA